MTGLMKAAEMPGNVAGLSYSQKSGAPAPRERPGAGRPEGVDMAEGTETRRVQLVGGPHDGETFDVATGIYTMPMADPEWSGESGMLVHTYQAESPDRFVYVGEHWA